MWLRGRLGGLAESSSKRLSEKSEQARRQLLEEPAWMNAAAWMLLGCVLSGKSFQAEAQLVSDAQSAWRLFFPALASSLAPRLLSSGQKFGRL